MRMLERTLDATDTMVPPSRESTSEEDADEIQEDDSHNSIPPYQVEEHNGDAPPQPDTCEGDTPHKNKFHMRG